MSRSRARLLFTPLTAILFSLTGLAVPTPAEAVTCLPNAVYTANQNGFSGLYALTDCGTSTRLLAGSFDQPVSGSRLSPDGKTVAFSMGLNPYYHLYTVSLAGGTPTTVTSGENYSDQLGAWSPDGAKLALFRLDYDNPDNTGLYTVQRGGTGLTKLNQAGPFTCLTGISIAWGADNRISHTSAENCSSYSISSIAANDTDPLVLVGPGPDFLSPLAWGPDNKSLLLEKLQGETRTIWLRKPDGSMTQIPTGNIRVEDAALDNDWTVYFAGSRDDETGARESGIFSVAFENPQASLMKRVGGIEGFDIYRTGDPQAPPPDEPPTPVPPAPPIEKNWQNLGDSFTSGEGAPGKNGYLSGTDTKTNKCHRSEKAYGPVAWRKIRTPNEFGFHACSGAKVEDFFVSRYPGEKPQLKHLGPNTSVVTLTIGGNNVNFGPVLEDCVFNGILGRTCEQVWGETINAALRNISTGTKNHNGRDNLPDLFYSIKQKVPNAKVYVIGYPRFFPKKRYTYCGTGIPSRFFHPSDMIWMNAQIAELNRILERSARKARLTYVNMYNAFEGHTLCTSDLWMNKITFPREESFHPNVKGHAQIARVVEKRIIEST